MQGSIQMKTVSGLHEAGVRGRGLSVNRGLEGVIVEAGRRNAALAKKNDWTLQIWIPLRAFVAFDPSSRSLA